jgi:hypothetical protein
VGARCREEDDGGEGARESHRGIVVYRIPTRRSI